MYISTSVRFSNTENPLDTDENEQNKIFKNFIDFILHLSFVCSLTSCDDGKKF